MKKLLSWDHFSVDGTLIEAWASTKSFRPKDTDGGDDSGAGPDGAGGGGNAMHDFHGEKLSNQTHAASTDPDARLYGKGRGKRRVAHGFDIAIAAYNLV